MKIDQSKTREIITKQIQKIENQLEPKSFEILAKIAIKKLEQEFSRVLYFASPLDNIVEFFYAHVEHLDDATEIAKAFNAAKKELQEAFEA